jgi:hypothetical protein
MLDRVPNESRSLPWDKVQSCFHMESGRKILKGKVALITGGAKRLGRASALALAKAGANVAHHLPAVSARSREDAEGNPGLGRLWIRRAV